MNNTNILKCDHQFSIVVDPTMMMTTMKECKRARCF